MENKKLVKQAPQWEIEFSHVRRNAVYFIEEYWNKLHPDAPLSLTDEEKQRIYNKYRMAPLVNDISAYMKRIDDLRAQGYKDWEIEV
ncbi:MAG: hypothetical protein ACFNYA_03375 [Capnocytophaga granulosa]|jgi:hypothetical protein